MLEHRLVVEHVSEDVVAAPPCDEGGEADAGGDAARLHEGMPHEVVARRLQHQHLEPLDDDILVLGHLLTVHARAGVWVEMRVGVRVSSRRRRAVHLAAYARLVGPLLELVDDLVDVLVILAPPPHTPNAHLQPQLAAQRGRLFVAVGNAVVAPVAALLGHVLRRVAA